MKNSLVALALLASETAYAQTPPATTPTPTPAPTAGPTPTSGQTPTPGQTPAPAPGTPPAGDASPPAPPAPPADDTKAQAKSLYEEGLGHYNLGEFDKAVEAFKKAYALSNAPGLLFNIAQSYRLAKNYEQASYFYTTYLRLKPDAPNRQDVEDRLAEMEKLIEEQKKLQNSAPVGTVNPDAQQTKETGPTITTTAPEPEGGIAPKTLMVSGIAAGGAGAALILTGVIFGSLAKSNQSDLESLQAMNGTWTQDAQDKYDAGKRDNAIAIVTYIVGGAAVATGGTLYVLGYLKKKRTTVALTPTSGGKTLAVGWSF